MMTELTLVYDGEYISLETVRPYEKQFLTQRIKLNYTLTYLYMKNLHGKKE